MANILLADDNNDYRDVFETGMTQLGHSVRAVGSADAARNVLEEEAFDIVFLDVVMPGGGAVTLVHEFTKNYPDLPIVVISGQAELYDTPLFREGLRMAKAVLRKTASLREINDTIRYLVN